MYCKKLVLIVLLILLSACQASNTGYYPSPTIKAIQPGTLLHLNHELVIPAELARVYLQSGKLIHANNVDRYHPNCSLEVRTLQASPRVISPGNFRILKITWDEEISSLRLIFASGKHFASDDDGPISHQNWVTHFYLQSEKQPDVFRLSCAHWEEPTEARHLTLHEIKVALGEYISFTQ